MLIGGLAAVVAGSSRATFDVDVVVGRPDVGRRAEFYVDLPARRHRLVRRGARGCTNEKLLVDSDRVIVFGLPIRFLNLAKLIELKRAAGRLRDLEAIAELELLRKRSR